MNCVRKCIFTVFYLLQMSFNKNITLEALFITNDMALLKKAIADLVKRRDYKTLNTLLRRNENVNLFDTRLLNEEIPQTDKRFTKRDGKLRNVAKPNNQSSSNDETQYYEPNTYEQATPLRYSRIRARYY